MTPELTRPRLIQRSILYLFGVTIIVGGLQPLAFAVLVLTGFGPNVRAAGFFFIASLFIGAGIGVICLARYEFNYRRELARLQEQWPKKPWTWREDWRNRKITHSHLTGAWLYTGILVLWNYFSWGGLALGFFSGAPGNVLIHVGIFCGIGLLLFGVAFRAVLLAQKWGKSHLELCDVPIGTGETLVGKIYLAHRCEIDDVITLTMLCSRRSKRNAISQLWSHARVVKSFLPTSRAGAAVIPVAFDIPPDAIGTSDKDDVSWRLLVSTSKGRLPFKADFEVPVYRTQPRDLRLANQEKLSRQFALRLGERTFDNVISEGYGRVICDLPNRVEIQIGLATLKNTVGIAVVVGGFFLMFWNLLGNNVVGLIFFGIGVLGVTLQGFATTRISADSENLHFRRGYFWIGRKRSIALEKIETIEPATKKQRNGHSLCINLLTTDETSHTLLDWVASYEIGTAIADRLNEHRKRFGSSFKQNHSQLARGVNFDEPINSDATNAV